MKVNPLNQVTFLLSLVFSVVYLVMGIALVTKFFEIPWLMDPQWLQISFGVGLILYSGVRFYRSYLIYQEAKEG
jgi:hypothetical protein